MYRRLTCRFPPVACGLLAATACLAQDQLPLQGAGRAQQGDAGTACVGGREAICIRDGTARLGTELLESRTMAFAANVSGGRAVVTDRFGNWSLGARLDDCLDIDRAG